MTVDLTRGETGRVLSVAAEAGLSAPQTAYVLATACWETAGTMRPVRGFTFQMWPSANAPRPETYR